MTVPVSGEDQPDPRVEALEAISRRAYFEGEDLGNERLLAALDAADRAAGIRRVTEQFTRNRMWAAWDDGYEAARNGQHAPFTWPHEANERLRAAFRSEALAVLRGLSVEPGEGGGHSPAALVAEFHRSFGLPVAIGPDAGPSDDLRLRLLAEEFREYADAVAAGDLVEVVDALADMVYVIYGTALVLGVDLDAALAEVHRSNMSKLQDGRPLLRADGKVLKGSGFTPPNLAALLPVAAPVPVQEDR